MSFLLPKFLLAAIILHAASSTPILAIAHDTIHPYVPSMQQRSMTSSVIVKLAKATAIPFAADTVSTFQQLKLGRNLLNNLDEEQQPQSQLQLRQQQRNVKSNKDNNEMKDDDDDDGDKDFVDLLSLSSVVENWSLVCKQLCGASLGGAPCAAECRTVPTDAKRSQRIRRNTTAKNAKDFHAIFEHRRKAICVDLCKVGLGGSFCNCGVGCSMAANKISRKQDFNKICDSFCQHAGATLKGCSPCSKEMATLDASSMVNGSKYARALAAGADSTPPNMDALCASLCKTGDGGSLCNCNLSPFFK